MKKKVTPSYFWPNLTAMFFDQVDKLGDKPFLWAKRNGVYKSLSWHDTAAKVTGLTRGLKTLGVQSGDRIVLVSENRPSWLIADIAIMTSGAITVPTYTTNTEADHLHVLSDSKAKGAIVSTNKLAEKLLKSVRYAPDIEFVITMEPVTHFNPSGYELLDLLTVEERGRAGRDNVVKMARDASPDDTACMIYTSGTGGTPKGVMLSHKAIMHNCEGAVDALRDINLSDEVFLSFLPLSHSYEHTAGQFFPMSIGAEIYYAEGIEALGSNMLEARPTIMTAVPRLYEMLHGRITTGLKNAGGLREKLFLQALKLGTQRYLEKPLGPIGTIQNVILDRVVRDKVRNRFGGRLKALVSGGAPLNPDIAMFFTGLGLRIMQGYGQTETAPVVCVNRASQIKLHTVGTPLKNTRVKIADDGEILVAGDLIMQGYWNDPEATKNTIKNGWVHTGDIGKFDSDGHLIITDRKKDIIVNSGGDNIAPQRVEGIICIEPEISQAMVYGDNHPYIVALIVPNESLLKDWISAKGKTGKLADISDDPDFIKVISGAIARVNNKLSNIEKVRKFIIADTPFTLQNAQLTPTMKIRRHKLKEIYNNRLERLYR
ncbi:MAG: long-chain fatty acid--CoA ligase [Rhodospirillaceae bacterium TMED8]|nr:long-chain fatty acid--CoA ligase [Magnetovibrio sp.]OUT50172.1 MAG: long-chain fatty acid--CoA ligase [Rhodospirillaceae bacterium TMED8]|tara:strand:- start:3203 stop:5002 length:1800 start_codon:yes stop_codon:yes gene_type:complete